MGLSKAPRDSRVPALRAPTGGPGPDLSTTHSSTDAECRHQGERASLHGASALLPVLHCHPVVPTEERKGCPVVGSQLCPEGLPALWGGNGGRQGFLVSHPAPFCLQ